MNALAILLTLLVVWPSLVLARTLPLQNVALIFSSLIACEWALETVWIKSNLPWGGLLIWPATIVLVRVGCRWILRRWRQDWNYGLWLIFLVSAAVALAQFTFARVGSPRAFAARMAAVRFAATAVCLFFLSPWFISKFPQQPHNHAQ
jgi:hypothetical protein